MQCDIEQWSQPDTLSMCTQQTHKHMYKHTNTQTHKQRFKLLHQIYVVKLNQQGRGGGGDGEGGMGRGG